MREESFSAVVESDLSHEFFSEGFGVELANELVEGGVREPAREVEEWAQEVVLREGFEFQERADAGEQAEHEGSEHGGSGPPAAAPVSRVRDVVPLVDAS